MELEAIQYSKIVLTSLFLGVISISDIENGKFNIKFVLLFILIGVVLIVVDPLTFEFNLEMTLIYLIPIAILLFTRLMGIGDLIALGVIVFISGSITISEREISLFTPIINGMFIAITVAMYYVIKRLKAVRDKKEKLKDPLITKNIPFLPFLLGGYLITVFYGDIIINSMPEVVYSLI